MGKPQFLSKSAHEAVVAAVGAGPFIEHVQRFRVGWIELSSWRKTIRRVVHVSRAEIGRKVGGIAAGIEKVEGLAIEVGRRRDEFCPAEVALDRHRKLRPFVLAYFVEHHDALQVAQGRIVDVVVVRFDFLVDHAGRDGPVVVDEPARRHTRTAPVGVIDVFACDG